MGWVFSVHNVRVDDAHVFVGIESLLLGLLTVLDPGVARFRPGHVVLDGANSSHALDSELRSNLGSGLKGVIFVGSHREVVVGEVDNFVGTFNADL